MRIVVINGQGGSGKDTFVDFCENFSNGVFSVSMVDGIKNSAKYLGWKGGKELKDRKFLSDLKDLSAKYNDFPFINTENIILERVKFLKEATNIPLNRIVCFVHAREPEDIKRWVEKYDALTVLIRRTEIEGDYGNHADDEVFNWDYDYVIYNDSTIDTLKSSAKIFMSMVLEKEEEPWGSYNVKLP